MKTRKRAPRKELPLHEYERLKNEAEIYRQLSRDKSLEINHMIASNDYRFSNLNEQLNKLNKEKKMYMWLFFLSSASIVGLYVYELLK